MIIAICDCDYHDREVTAGILKHYFSKYSISYKIYEFDSGTNIIYDFEDGTQYDLIILECRMKKSTGIGTAKKLRNKGYTGDIIFITYTTEFAVAGYEVGAAAYLLKPLCYEKLYKTMDKILKSYSQSFYKIYKRNIEINIPYNEITFVESNNSKCTMHCRNGKEYVIYKHLSDIEQGLNDKRFLRCHRSFIVNMNYISRVEKQFILSTGDFVLIRQKSLKQIKQTYFDYQTNILDGD